MAKTLIGNVKGKDGRGITKIEKTATTGAIDTYTITYTDGTTSTYKLQNSDDIAIQRQIVPSAAVESSTTASQAYAAGNYVVVGGVLRRVTAAIAKGNTISDSNSTATTVTVDLANAKSKMDKIYLSDAVSAVGFHEWADGIQITFDGASGNPQFQITFDNNGIVFYKNGTRQWSK